MSDMKLEISRDALSVVVGKIEGVISSFETVPVLKTYHLQAVGKELKVAATDMELGVTVRTTVDELAQEGDVAMPAKKLNEIVKSLPEGVNLSISVKDGIVTICSGKTRWKIRGILGSEFPEMPVFADSAQVWVLKREELLVILERLSPLVVPDTDIRVCYKAISVGESRIMATDGEVLGSQRHEFSCGSVEQIPGACTRDLMAVLKLSGEDEVSVIQGEEFVFIEVGDDIFFTRLLDNWAFPDVNELLTNSAKVKKFGHIDRQAFLSAVQRVKVTSSAEKQEIQLSFRGNGLKLTTSTREGDSAEEGIGFKKTDETLAEATDINCVVNWTKLVLGLSSMQSDRVDIKILDSCFVLADPGIFLGYIMMRRDVLVQ